jgi:hypothetical protein
VGDIVYARDVRLVGALCPVPTRMNTRIVVANPETAQLVTIAIGGTAPSASSSQIRVLAASDLLDAPPRAVALADDVVYALGEDLLCKVADGAAMDAAGFAVNQIAVECSDPRWLCVRNGFAYLPLGAGGISVYTIAGALVATYAAVLGRTTQAILDPNRDYLYAVDTGAARAVALAINADGTLAAQPEVALTGCKAIRGVSVSNDYLAVALGDAVALFSLADPAAPAFTERISFAGYSLNGLVAVGGDRWWIASEEYLTGQADRFDYRSAAATYIAGRGVYALSNRTGRLIGTGDFVATEPTAGGGDGGGGEVSSRFILTEASDPIDAEDTDNLLQEDP